MLNEKTNVIALDQRIYPKHVIERAIQIYSNVAHMEIVNQTDTLINVSLGDSNVDSQLLKNEFCNYLIYLISYQEKTVK